MRYPILQRSKLRMLATQLMEGQSVSIEPHVQWEGLGEEIDLHPLETLGERMAAAAGEVSTSDKDRLEGRFAPELEDALGGVPAAVLDDPRFWAYLSLAYFWDFIACREEAAFGRGNHMKYIDGESSTEAVLPRMYLRSRSVGGTDYSELTSAVPKGTDFWRSHVIRVKTGTAPPVARSLVREHSSDRMKTPDLRELARELNRTWSNVVPYLYDDHEAAQLIDELRSNVEDG